MQYDQEMIEACSEAWSVRSESMNVADAFMSLFEDWPAWVVTSAYTYRFWMDFIPAARLMSETPLTSVVKNEVRTIVAYYPRIQGGGAQKVFRDLVKLWVSMGYSVVMAMNDDEPVDLDFVPENVSLHQIPSLAADPWGQFPKRAQAWENLLRECNADAVMYLEWNSPALIWDMMLAKAVGCAFVIPCQSVFSLRLTEAKADFAAQPRVFANADAVVCLSDVDRAFWKNFNSHTFDAMIPLVREYQDMPQSTLDGRTLIWVGRFAPEKRPADAIRIFAEVRKSVPDARLLMVGKGLVPEDEDTLRRLAEELGVVESVEFCGFQKDMVPYYQQGSVLLATSEYEGFHLAAFEAQAHGIPVVMYKQLNLRWADGSEGVVVVPNGDIASSARAAAELLQNSLSLEAASASSVQSIADWKAYDLEDCWQSAIDSLSQERPAPDETAVDQIMWTILLDHYAYGIDKLKGQLYGELDASRDDLRNVTGSASFRVGRALTWLPRKIRDVLKRQR